MVPPWWAANKNAKFLLQLSVYLFPVVAILSSIPVFSIVVKCAAELVWFLQFRLQIARGDSWQSQR
jgi:uncharacterized membrane protein